MKDQIEEFRAYRAKMNERILAADNKVIKESTISIPILIWKGHSPPR